MVRPRQCLIGDRLVAEAEAGVPVLDRGFLYGEGLFETLRAYGGRPFLLAEHWARLSASAAFLGLPVPAGDPAARIDRVLRANGLAEASVRVTLTRGTEPAGPRPGPGGPPTLLVQTRPLREDIPRQAEEGVAGARVPWPLRARGLPLQAHKTLGYLSSVVALGAVPEEVEPILENTEGHLAETATANLFWVQEGRLLTPHPDAGCLPGVTRGLVLELARSLGFEVEEGFYSAEALAGAAEAFLTNSVIEVVPLVTFAGRAVGSGRPGPVTRALQRAYREAVERAESPG